METAPRPSRPTRAGIRADSADASAAVGHIERTMRAMPLRQQHRQDEITARGNVVHSSGADARVMFRVCKTRLRQPLQNHNPSRINFFRPCLSIPQIENPLPHARDAGLPRDYKCNCAKRHDGYTQAHQARLNKSPLYVTTGHLWQKLQRPSLHFSNSLTEHAQHEALPSAPTGTNNSTSTCMYDLNRGPLANTSKQPSHLTVVHMRA